MLEEEQIEAVVRGREKEGGGEWRKIYDQRDNMVDFPSHSELFFPLLGTCNFKGKTNSS